MLRGRLKAATLLLLMVVMKLVSDAAVIPATPLVLVVGSDSSCI